MWRRRRQRPGGGGGDARSTLAAPRVACSRSRAPPPHRSKRLRLRLQRRPQRRALRSLRRRGRGGLATVTAAFRTTQRPGRGSGATVVAPVPAARLLRVIAVPVKRRRMLHMPTDAASRRSTVIRRSRAAFDAAFVSG